MTDDAPQGEQNGSVYKLAFWLFLVPLVLLILIAALDLI